MIKKQSEE